MKSLVIVLLVIGESLPLLYKIYKEQVAAAPAPAVAVAAEREGPPRVRVERILVSVSEPKTALGELYNRMAVSRVYWAAGDATDDIHPRNTAVGILDASCPIPGCKSVRVGSRYSKFGPLNILLESVEAEGGFGDKLGLPVYNPVELERLWRLANPRRNGGAYLMLTFSEYRELMQLLLKLKAPDWGSDAN